MAKYRSKVVEIEAFQLTRRNTGPEPFPDWFDDAVGRNEIVTHGMGKFGEGPVYCEIRTLEGVMRANEGDWIIRGTEGELYPCKQSVFERKYERAE
jgi:hypothetical protein